MLENAFWISYKEDLGFHAPIFRRRFTLDKEIKSAALKISSRGCYYAELNGKRVGNFILAPGFTAFSRVQVQEYDVTNMLCAQNELLVTLSKGWFKGRINWRVSVDHPDMYEALILELTIKFKDGTKKVICSDKDFEASPSKITMTDIYDGEHYDCQYEYDFSPVKVQDYDKCVLVPQQGEYILEQEILRPVSIIKTPLGETVLDFGQNLTGYVEFDVNALEGQLVDISFGEILDKNGNFYNENYRTAKSELKYICKDGYQSYKPLLTFYGFRYIRLNSFPAGVTLDSVRAIVVHSDIKRTGYLDSSSPLLNKLFKNIIWGQKGNFLDVPTDCPQRDERMGWTGDAQVFVKTASYNFNVKKFFEKWLTDLKLEQHKNGYVPRIIPHCWSDEWSRAAWGDASTICPWQIYMTYGDKRVLKSQFDSMRRYVKYIGSVSKDKYLWTGGDHFGDWLGLDAPYGSYKGSSNEDFIASVYYAYSTSLVIKAGEVLNKDVEKYKRLYDKIIQKTRKVFKEYKTQTECVLALYFDIATDKAAVAKQLATMIRENGNKLKTGFVGTPYLLHALSQNGYADLAYDLLLQEEFPSWLYSVKQGATTIWEHWDGVNDKGELWSSDMNSFNHYAYGSVADWVYEVACGIKPIKPGFADVVIEPHPTDKLEYLSAKIDTVQGEISSRWYHTDGKIRYEITTPVPATVIIDGVSRRVEKGSYIF